MRPTAASLLKRWHKMLNLSRQSPSSWYRDRLREELQEHRMAKTSCQKLSEASDVFFSISRAQYDGYPVRRLPPFVAPRHIFVYAYMLAKYTSRWKFYRAAATMCNAPNYDLVREVVNPSKDRKLEEVASRHQIDPAEFKRYTEELTVRPTIRNNSASGILDAMAEFELKGSEGLEIRSASDDKAIVVGLYGVSGCGKSHLLEQLEQKFGGTNFAFYDGSDMIGAIVPGGLEAFEGMEKSDQEYWRKRAIDQIGQDCTNSKKMGVVAGHFMFWSEEEQAGTLAWNDNDQKVFTHILYLDVAADVVAERRRNDKKKERPPASVNHLREWQRQEKVQLKDLCRQHGILFSLMTPRPSETTLFDRVSTLLLDFKSHDEDYNLSQAKSRLDDFVAAGNGQLKTVLVMDADRTLAPDDTGVLFWEKVSKLLPLEYDASTLKTLFTGPLRYSYKAFRQAMLLYEEAVDGQKFDDLCQEVALAVTMHREFVLLLQLLAEEERVGAVVVTSGLRHIWLKVLEKEGLSEKVEVIGGGRIEDHFVVTAAVKGALVTHLQNVHKIYVCAFGDSPLDLEMLCKANQAVIVVGEEHKRSAAMDKALKDAIDSHGLRAKQVLLPSTASPRLDTTRLPLTKLLEPNLVKFLLGIQNPNGGLQVLHATDKNAAKLLATPMRDAAVAGPNLREAHRRVGHYLAIENLADVIGIEPCPIQHVQGKTTSGYQLFHEQKSIIVALMRGGEPMALGVSDAFPRAMFVHASDPENLKPHHLDGQITVILVDSVVNTGKTIVEFVQHVRKLHATIRIVVVAGVVQDQCVTKDGFKQALAPYGKVHLVALRLSETKFTGSGTTDTGNRLFNTTHLA